MLGQDLEIARPKLRQATLPPVVKAACGDNCELLVAVEAALSGYAQEYHAYFDGHFSSDVLFCASVPKVIRELEAVDPTLIGPYLRLLAQKPPLNADLDTGKKVIDPYRLLDDQSVPRRLVELREACGEHFDVAIEYAGDLTKHAYSKKNLAGFNLTEEFSVAEYEPLIISKTVSHLRKILPPETITTLLNVTKTHSHLDTNLLCQLLYVAAHDEANYPGGIMALLDDLATLPMPAAKTWYEVAGDLKDSCSRVKVKAFLAKGREFIASLGDLGHHWFIAWSADMDLEAVAQEFLLAATFSNSTELVIDTDGDREEILHGLAFRCDRYPVGKLLALCRQTYREEEKVKSSYILLLLRFTESYAGLLIEEEFAEDAATIKLLSNEIEDRSHTTYVSYRNWGLLPYQAKLALAVTVPVLSTSSRDERIDQADSAQLQSFIVALNDVAASCPADLKNCDDGVIFQYRVNLLNALTLADKVRADTNLNLHKVAKHLSFKLGLIETEHEFRKSTCHLPTPSPLARRLALIYGGECKSVNSLQDVKFELQCVRGKRQSSILDRASSFITEWGQMRSRLAGLLVVGGKIHVQKAIDDKLFERIKAQLGLTSTPFRLERSGKSIVLPAGHFIDLQILIKTLAQWGLFDEREPDLQLSMAGRWPEPVAAIVGSSVMLASDRAVFYGEDAFSTTQDEKTGAKIMVYDDGIRWTGPFDIPNAKGRTDMLGRNGLDAQHYQILGTLATHGVYGGIWSDLFKDYQSDYIRLITRNRLAKTIRSSQWIYDLTNDTSASRKEHLSMVNGISKKWENSQRRPNLGVVGEVRKLISNVVQAMAADREKVAEMYPEDFAKLLEPTFVYGMVA